MTIIEALNYLPTVKKIFIPDETVDGAKNAIAWFDKVQEALEFYYRKEEKEV